MATQMPSRKLITDVDDILEKASVAVMPSLMATQMALCEQSMAKGLELAADTLVALADDIIAKRAPVTDIKEAAAYLRSIADKKRTAASKILHKN